MGGGWLRRAERRGRTFDLERATLAKRDFANVDCLVLLKEKCNLFINIFLNIYVEIYRFFLRVHYEAVDKGKQ